MNESNILKKTHLTHLQGLYSLADLLIKINPMKYPAFAFAWLELISHKTFMPEFLGIA
jgi:CCR4-NOT transcription complex subunit 1